MLYCLIKQHVNHDSVAAEYIAKGYVLSDHILQQAIEIDSGYYFHSFVSHSLNFYLAKQGISKRFLDFFRGVDKSVGEKALGPDQTVSQKLQATVGSAAQRAKAVDEQKGYSKIAQDVRIGSSRYSNLHSQI